MILQQTLARFLNSHWRDCSTVTGMTIQQSLAWFFISRWRDSWTVAGMILRQSLARFFNSYWHDCSTVTGTIVQQLLAQFFNSKGNNFFYRLAEFFNSDVHCWRIVPCTRNTTHDPLSFVKIPIYLNPFVPNAPFLYPLNFDVWLGSE